MSLMEKVHTDMVAAMKSKDTDRLSTLRMMKTALKNREIDKRAPLTEQEGVQILVTMVKQRRDSIEQFTKGNRPELAAREAAEISLIESYMPKAAGEAEIRSMVSAAISELSENGHPPTQKEMGAVMKAVQAKIQAAGVRADGKLVS
ncbi:MAG TPA: GatB/YqeY domain-containing protein, partial [Acidobacteriaceae bacterium]|nr:GatB/YqeY domain-containing protein [Acidobacteriaceae bacterium]